MSKRSYADPCGLARALGAVGERWALLVVRELLFGPKRFTDLVRGLPHMSQNVLSQRLRELEQAKIVHKKRLGPPVSAQVYELTARGQELESVLLALATWGSQEPLPETGALSTDALMLALKTTYEPTRADHLSARIGLRLADETFVAEIASGTLSLQRAESTQVDATIACSAETLRAIVFAGRPLESTPDVEVSGDRARAERFVACFPRPASRG
jgi:DNA-binding HxlR family transcriptional regulator